MSVLERIDLLLSILFLSVWIGCGLGLGLAAGRRAFEWILEDSRRRRDELEERDP